LNNVYFAVASDRTLFLSLNGKIVTDTLGEYMDCERTYQTVCIDEAHFLKSLVTYWGAAAGLLGIHAERMIAMSGTPFVSRLQNFGVFFS